MKLNKISFLLLLLSCCLIVGCSQKKEKSGKWQDTMTTGLIPIAVDGSFEPIIQAELDVFEMIYPYTGVEPIYTTETEALKLLSEDSVRMVIVSRRLTEAEKATYKARNMFPKEWKIATDAIALIINKSNPDSIISVSTLKKILTGEITKWKEINPKSPLTGEISVVFDNKNSATVRYAMDSICEGAELSAKLYAEKKNKDVINYVSESPHALGIIGVNWVGSDSDSTRTSKKFDERVTVMAVSRLDDPTPSTAWQPFQAYIHLKNYPLTRDVYIILNDPKGGLSSGLTSFICSQRGQYILLKSGLVPAMQDILVRPVEIKN